MQLLSDKNEELSKELGHTQLRIEQIIEKGKKEQEIYQ